MSRNTAPRLLAVGSRWWYFIPWLLLPQGPLAGRMSGSQGRFGKEKDLLLLSTIEIKRNKKNLIYGNGCDEISKKIKDGKNKK